MNAAKRLWTGCEFDVQRAHNSTFRVVFQRVIIIISV